MLQSFYNVIKNFNTQILFIGHLIKIKFIWITVFASQVRQEMFVLGLESHLS